MQASQPVSWPNTSERETDTHDQSGSGSETESEKTEPWLSTERPGRHPEPVPKPEQNHMRAPKVAGPM